MKGINKSDFDNNLLFGTRPVQEALDAGTPLDKIFVVKGSSSDAHRAINKTARQHGVPVKLVPQEKLHRLTKKNHQGVVAFASPVPFHSLEILLPDLYEQGKTPLLLLLDGVTDVRNFGAIARSAECFGVHAVIIGGDHAAPINGEAVKSSAGALFNIPVCRDRNLLRAADFLKKSGLRLIACTEKAEASYETPEFDGPMCLVMGAEDAGISEGLIELCDEHVVIPMVGKTPSLNVSVATGIVLSKISSQRMKKGLK